MKLQELQAWHLDQAERTLRIMADCIDLVGKRAAPIILIRLRDQARFHVEAAELCALTIWEG